MSCKNCLQNYPGKLVKAEHRGNKWFCTECGDEITSKSQLQSEKTWDSYFLSICNVVASHSKCLSRQIGVVLVRDKSIIATGYNGPARGIPHCGSDRYEKDRRLQDAILQSSQVEEMGMKFHNLISSSCPRQILGFKSGQGLEWCIAAHAEQNCIANAARMGVCIKDATLYMNTQTPCKACLSTLINAGVGSIVVTSLEPYDNLGNFLLRNSEIKIRLFDI